MNILCIAQCEDRTNLDEQILKQTVQPDRTIFYVDNNPSKGIEDRRKRIVENHEKLRAIVIAYKPTLVWQVEQDAVFERDTLERLIQRHNELKSSDFGYISGIQVGRHGLYHIGAWKNFTGDSFESIDHTLMGVQEVDATGFYCLLMERDKWLSGTASYNGEPYGPDVNWGLSMPYKKYVDMGIEVGHKIKSGIIYPRHLSTCTVRYFKKNGKWDYKQL